MKGPDLDRLHSEKKLTLRQFITLYNEGLPTGYPPVTGSILRVFSKSHPHLFKEGDVWSLDLHRKKVMDWMPAHLRNSTQEE